MVRQPLQLRIQESKARRMRMDNQFQKIKQTPESNTKPWVGEPIRKAFAYKPIRTCDPNRIRKKKLSQ